jgi:hypothetical protein
VNQGYNDITLQTHWNGCSKIPESTRCWQGLEKWKSPRILVGMHGTATLENVCQCLEVTNINLPFNLANSLLEIYPTELKTYMYIMTWTWELGACLANMRPWLYPSATQKERKGKKKDMYLNVHRSLILIAKTSNNLNSNQLVTG